MDKYTIGQFKKDLKKDSKKLFNFIYKVYFPKIKNFISKNSGSSYDAKDVFQEAVIAIIRNVEDNKVNENTGFEAYLYSVCRYIWLNVLRAPKFNELEESNISESYGLEEEDLPLIEESIEKSIFQRNFIKLDEPCQRMLRYFFDKMSLKEIAEKFGFKDENYTKKRKHICKERLVKMIKEDPDYKIFMKDKDI